MKFTVSSADLLKALTTVAGAVPTKSTLPILESILFESDEHRLQICLDSGLVANGPVVGPSDQIDILHVDVVENLDRALVQIRPAG